MTLCKHRLEMTNYDHWKLVQCTKPSRGTPGMGEIPIKNKKCLQVWEYGFIILKIVLWAHFTITHAV